MGTSTPNIVGLALLCGCFGGCGTHSEPAATGGRVPAGPVRAQGVSSGGGSHTLFTCKASAAKNAFAVGTPVVVTVSLDNGLSRPVAIRDYPWHHPFFSFEVRGPDGRPLPLAAEFPSPAQTRSDEWKSLPAGETYAVEIDLDRWYDLSTPGTYEVTARWCLYAKQEPYERRAEPIRIEMTSGPKRRAVEESFPAETDKPGR